MSIQQPPSDVPVLREIVERDHVWPTMTAKYGVSNPLPPWKSSLDALCDVLDRSTCDASVPDGHVRRNEEDVLVVSTYPTLPYPENQLVALAHSLITHDIISEEELRARLAAVRERLES